MFVTRKNILLSVAKRLRVNILSLVQFDSQSLRVFQPVTGCNSLRWATKLVQDKFWTLTILNILPSRRYETNRNAKPSRLMINVLPAETTIVIVPVDMDTPRAEQQSAENDNLRRQSSHLTERGESSMCRPWYKGYYVCLWNRKFEFNSRRSPLSRCSRIWHRRLF